MKLIVAGTRTLRVEAEFIKSSLVSFGILDQVKEVVSGGAEGVDWAGEEFSIDFLDKEPKVFQADWSSGHQGGPARNKKMAEYGDALLLIWDGRTDGSASMKTEMLKLRKPIYEIIMKAAE